MAVQVGGVVVVLTPLLMSRRDNGDSTLGVPSGENVKGRNPTSTFRNPEIDATNGKLDPGVAFFMCLQTLHLLDAASWLECILCLSPFLFRHLFVGICIPGRDLNLTAQI